MFNVHCILYVSLAIIQLVAVVLFCGSVATVGHFSTTKKSFRLFLHIFIERWQFFHLQGLILSSRLGILEVSDEIAVVAVIAVIAAIAAGRLSFSYGLLAMGLEPLFRFAAPFMLIAVHDILVRNGVVIWDPNVMSPDTVPLLVTMIMVVMKVMVVVAMVRVIMVAGLIIDDDCGHASNEHHGCQCDENTLLGATTGLLDTNFLRGGISLIGGDGVVNCFCFFRHAVGCCEEL